MSSSQPVLSGLPPLSPTPTCRACSTAFFPLLQPRKTCYHCGFSWCIAHLHTEGKVLLPRGGGRQEYKNVCRLCWVWLKMSSSTEQELSSLPVKQLTGYLKAYGHQLPAGALEKSQLVAFILRLVGPQRVQPPEREAYYRKNSVPEHFILLEDSTPPPSLSRPTPPSAGAAQPAAASTTRTPPVRSSREAPPSSPQPPRTTSPLVPRAPPSRTSAPQPSNTRQPPSRTPPGPLPASASSSSGGAGAQLLSQLLAHGLYASAAEEAGGLSVGALKAVLNAGCVRYDGVLEKRELVDKVLVLVRAERARLGRQEARERDEVRPTATTDNVTESTGAGEEWEEVPQWVKDEWAAAVPSTDLVAPTQPPSVGPSHPPPPSTPVATATSTAECVVCCDSEATHAAISCGHRCLCGPCVDAILASSRECPLCRTWVGVQGFLRIYV